jgi:hypothetical protein
MIHDTVRWMPWFFVCGEALMAFVFLGMAFICYGKRKAKLAQSSKIEAEVIEVQVNHDTKHPVIRYRLPNGQTMTWLSTYGSSNWTIQVGDRLNVYVDPTEPGKPILDIFLPKWEFAAILGAMGVFALVGVPILAYVLLISH